MAVVQFKFIVPLLFAAHMFVSSIQATDVKYCDNKNDYAVKVHGVDISPDPVTRGTPATFKISASTDQAISEGKLELGVSYFGIHIHDETIDLCSETSCPVSVGDFVLSHTQTLPVFTPPGTYTLKMKLSDGKGAQLTCINFDFSIGFWSPVAYS